MLKRILTVASIIKKRWWYFTFKETTDSRITSKEEIKIRKRIIRPILFFKGVSGVSSFKMSPILCFVLTILFKLSVL
tara:strand:+ start:99 stop:329 length:231 start_codon:yes stop_codon:yes gene_type:complete